MGKTKQPFQPEVYEITGNLMEKFGMIENSAQIPHYVEEYPLTLLVLPLIFHFTFSYPQTI